MPNGNGTSKTCYMHDVDDPNAEHYDPEKHTICLVCAVKLWELARAGLEFDCRDSVVELRLRKSG